MATTLTNPTSTEVETVTFSFPISKTERDADGDLVVYGPATDGTVDSDRQIVDPEWSGKALADWLSTGGNVRMSHDPTRPVGKGLSVELDRDGNDQHWVKSVIVDPTAQRLIEKGVLRAYSVGISQPVIKRDPTGRAPGGIICGGELSELSIVDRPANKNSYLELGKSAGSSIELTGVLHEGVAEDALTKAAGTFTPADLAKLLEHRRAAEKRNMDPDVGGGVDRDKIPASDFVDPKGRRFPIVTAADVSDAVSSYGRAKPKIPFDKFKRRVTSIARRKGFESSLPDKWTQSDSNKANKGVMQANPPQTPVSPPAAVAAPQGHPAPPAGPQTPLAKPVEGPQAAAAGAASQTLPQGHPESQVPAVTKCGCGMDMDGGYNFCPGCGAPNGHSEDKGNPYANPTDSQGNMTVEMPMHPAAPTHDGQPAAKASKGPTGSVGEPVETEPVEPVRNAKKKPKKNTAKLSPDVKGVGKKPGKLKTPKATPGTDMAPGAAVKSVDAALQTAMLLKQLKVPSDLGALHDLTCPGFHPADAAKCHPGYSLKSLDVQQWQVEALNAAARGSLGEAAEATERWQAAETVKNLASNSPADVLAAQRELHKAFQDAQEGPGTAPVPTQIRAGQFKRPNVTAGHARLSSGHDGPNTADVPTGQISASDYTRGYLDSGHADEDQSNKGMDPRPIKYPATTGRVTPVDYTIGAQQAAKNAMTSMHDHLAQTFPDLCPMGSVASPVPAGETAIPQPVGSVKTVEAEVAKSAGIQDVASLIADLKESFAVELRTLNKSLKSANKRNNELQKTVDAMASMPDPNVAAFRGVALTHPINKGASSGARSVADTAEQTQLMMLRNLEDQFRKTDNPAVREAAWDSILKMRGLA